MQLGKDQGDGLLNERIKRIAVNQCCTLVYTVRIFTFNKITLYFKWSYACDKNCIVLHLVWHHWQPQGCDADPRQPDVGRNGHRLVP